MRSSPVLIFGDHQYQISLNSNNQYQVRYCLFGTIAWTQRRENEGLPCNRGWRTSSKEFASEEDATEYVERIFRGTDSSALND